MEDRAVVMQTPKGKVVEVVKHIQGSLWKAQFASGGELPTCLNGSWTSKHQAEESVRAYLEKKHATAEKQQAKKKASKKA